jgi:putative aldouronate transport system substrate-binding protein
MKLRLLREAPRMVNRHWSGVLRAILLIGMLGTAVLGCSMDSDGEKNNGQAVTAEKENAAGCEQPVTITTAKALRSYDVLRDGDTVDDNPITRWAKERLCIVQTNKWLVVDQNEALTERIRSALAGGEALPDVLFLTNHDLPGLLADLAGSGAIMDVGEPFERYAPERIKAAYASNPDVWRTVTLGGKRWGLPQFSDGKLADPILWIRQDWLDRLGLAAPATLTELEAVMEAFANGDPDGNGKRDTVPLAVAGQHTLNGWMGDVSFLFGAYGNQPYQWNRAADGSLAYGSVQPEVKKALVRLADWYKRGYLAPDFGTHDEQEASALFSTGAAGILSGPGWMGGWPLNYAKAEMPGSEFTPLPHPAGDEGRMGRIGTLQSYGSYFFREGFEHWEAIFAYYDEVYGSLTEDPDSDFAYGFGEGYDYKIENGEPVFDFPGMTATLSNFLLIAPGTPPANMLQGESIESRVLRGKVETSYERKLATTASRLFLKGNIVQDMQPGTAQAEQFVGPYTPTMALKWTWLREMEHKTFLKIVYGDAAADTFDDFVRQWEANGGSVIASEVNEWDRAAR